MKLEVHQYSVRLCAQPEYFGTFPHRVVADGRKIVFCIQDLNSGQESPATFNGVCDLRKVLVQWIEICPTPDLYFEIFYSSVRSRADIGTLATSDMNVYSYHGVHDNFIRSS